MFPQILMVIYFIFVVVVVFLLLQEVINLTLDLLKVNEVRFTSYVFNPSLYFSKLHIAQFAEVKIGIQVIHSTPSSVKL